MSMNYLIRGREEEGALAVREEHGAILVTDRSGKEHRVAVREGDRPGVHVVTIGERCLSVGHAPKSGGRHLLTIAGAAHEVQVVEERMEKVREFARADAAGAGHQRVEAPIPGLITEIKVEPGQEVEADQTLVVLYAMKLENEIRAQAAGVVQQVHVKPQQSVEKGAVLVELEAPSDADE